MKICRTCKVAKTLRRFYRHATAVDGHRNECIECTVAYQRERYRLKGEQIRAQAKSYRDSAHGRAVIRAYRSSERGRQRQRESQRFWRGSRRLEQRA